MAMKGLLNRLISREKECIVTKQESKPQRRVWSEIDYIFEISFILYISSLIKITKIILLVLGDGKPYWLAMGCFIVYLEHI